MTLTSYNLVAHGQGRRGPLSAHVLRGSMRVDIGAKLQRPGLRVRQTRRARSNDHTAGGRGPTCAATSRPLREPNFPSLRETTAGSLSRSMPKLGLRPPRARRYHPEQYIL
jgi:hypothetical protein